MNAVYHSNSSKLGNEKAEGIMGAVQFPFLALFGRWLILPVCKGLLCFNYPKTQDIKGHQVKIRNAISNNGDVGVLSGLIFRKLLAVKVRVCRQILDLGERHTPLCLSRGILLNDASRHGRAKGRRREGSIVESDEYINKGDVVHLEMNGETLCHCENG
ncbi:hypothetical protein HNY73_009237 [Argiope bruennichi]|uniref:Uncharacterized protein n=1 Tax=Argiope bruennichi TaxID=94029 RepID=A0A8T0F9V5_ARGBR|nr:hypothetical protein HNY73_009237 [Argiope bruennichi]